MPYMDLMIAVEHRIQRDDYDDDNDDDDAFYDDIDHLSAAITWHRLHWIITLSTNMVATILVPYL